MQSVINFHAANPHTDLILINRGIDRALYYQLSNEIKGRHLEACTIFLTTYGGDPDAAYRIGRCLRHHYDRVCLVVPSYCKSAGTLITICANELAIGDLGELGPLDIQVRNSNELYDHDSGLDYIQAIQATFSHTLQVFIQALDELKRAGGISTKIAGEFAAKLAESASVSLYSQIDPMKLGGLQRKMNIAMEYGKRLGEYSMNLKPKALERLIGGYPAHSFVIDRKEATELFENVRHMSGPELDILQECYNHLLGPAQFGPVLYPGDNHEQTSSEATNQ